LDTEILNAFRDFDTTNYHEEHQRYKSIKEITKERMKAEISSRGSSPGQGNGPFSPPELPASSNGHNEGNRKKAPTQRKGREEQKEFQERIRSKRDEAGDEWLRLSGFGRTKVRY
jgi:hypothetical protein